MLAAHAAIAIENAASTSAAASCASSRSATGWRASCTTRSRRSCSASCSTAEAAATLLDRDPDEARGPAARVQELAARGMEELRSLIFELRPPDARERGARRRAAQARRRPARVHGRTSR